MRHGVLVLRSNGGFDYSSEEHFHGDDSFAYAVTDGEETTTAVLATITIRSVNDEPEVELALSGIWSTEEDQRLVVNAPGLLAYATDADHAQLMAELQPSSTRGSVLVHSNGGFEFRPESGFSGDTTFLWRAWDGEAYSSSSTVTITVTPINDHPVGVDDAFILAEDNPLNVPSPGVLANDTDADDLSSDLTATLVSSTTLGIVSLSPGGGFTYAPGPNVNGSDSFTYQVHDDGGGSSAVTTVRLEVSPVNDPPVANDDDYLIDDGSALSRADDEGVLVNDLDPDGDRMSAILSRVPDNGSVELEPDGAFEYTADPGVLGEDSFVYLVTDGALTSLPAIATIRVVTPGDTTDSGPGAQETDTGCPQRVLYIDRDGDGFGTDVEVCDACRLVDGLAEVKGDCDDTRSEVYPGAREVVGDGIDQDCNNTDGAIRPLGACAVGSRGAFGLWPVLLLVGLGRRRRGSPGGSSALAAGVISG